MTVTEDETKRPNETHPRPDPFLIAGMHRSGTSLIAKLLYECGLDLGPASDLAAAKPENPEGFFESLRFVALNEEILESLGTGWDDPRPIQKDELNEASVLHLRLLADEILSEFEGAGPWGWKDPRNSRTAPFWKQVYPGARFILCVRNPLEVALSLHKRNHLSWELGLALWMRYNEAILDAVSPEDRLVTHYERYFEDPGSEIRRVASFCGLSPDDASVTAAAPSARQDLRNNKFTWRHLIETGLSDRLLELYRSLCAEAGVVEGVAVLDAALETSGRNRDGGMPPHAINRWAVERILDGGRVPGALGALEARRQVVPTADERQGRAEPAKLTSRLRVDLKDAEVQEFQESVAKLERRLASEADGARESRAKLAGQEALNEGLVQDLSEAKAVNEGLVQDLSEAKAVNEELALNLSGTRTLNEGLVESLSEAKTANENLARKLQDSEARLRREQGDSEHALALARQAYLNARSELHEIHASRLWQAGSMYWRALRFLRLLPERKSHPPLPPDVLPVQPGVGAALFDVRIEPSDNGGLRAVVYLAREKVFECPLGSGFAIDASREESPMELEPVRETAPVATVPVREVSSAPVVPIALSPRPAPVPTEGVAFAGSLIAEFEDRFGHSPSVLDWDTGLSLATSFPSVAVFSPAKWTKDVLPYIESSVDVVMLRAGQPDKEQEARRVAGRVLVTIGRGGVSSHTVEWLEGTESANTSTASILIPVHNQLHHTKTCLEALKKTLPTDFRGEIIVVDDASTDATWSFLETWASEDSRYTALRNEKNLGFVDSCNRAAEASSGEFLIFLNNDTIPRKGWFEALIGTFASYPDAGAVGGKLIYPDGRLQEAGGRIFSDASGVNMGKFDTNPDAPIYSFVRDVDYCSGALLATRRTIWKEIGGFDIRFRPAYYEDTDYCFSVRDRGWRVLYQPASVVVHVEGATAGTDLGSGAKRYQVVNREKFIQKWNVVLAKHPIAPDRIDHAAIHRLAFPGGCKRILVISHTVPEYDKESGSKRLFDLLKALRDGGWGVSFMAPWVPGGERYVKELQQMGIATYEKGLKALDGEIYKREADRLIATGMFDVALICFWHIAEEWMPVIKALSGKTKIVVDSVDLHLLRGMRARLRSDGKGPVGTLDSNFADEMRREVNMYALADRVLTVSKKEASMINDFVSRPGHAQAVPDVEELALSPWSFEERKGIVFIGSFRHPPNVEGVKYLFREILPLVDPAVFEEHPLYIVGTDLKDDIRALGNGLRYVRMVGWVPCVTPYLELARVSILPLLSGAGTKRKFIQACMIGTPNVATSIAAEGLVMCNGEQALIADDPATFAQGIERLVDDKNLWSSIQGKARQHVIERHSEKVAAEALTAALS